VLKILDEIFEVAKVSQINILVAWRTCWVRGDCARSQCGNLHEMHPAIGDPTVLEEVNNGPTVGHIHVQKDVIIGRLTISCQSNFWSLVEISKKFP
jgi:hypothetical protein